MRITKYKLELPNTLVKELATNYNGNSLDNPYKIVDMLNDVFRLNKASEEFVYMVAFSTKMKPLGVFEISHGTINSSLISPREILVRALLINAARIIIVHNHPSGDTTPSKEDMNVTKNVSQSSSLIGIELLDHIIIGENFYSFNEHNMIR